MMVEQISEITFYAHMLVKCKKEEITDIFPYNPESHLPYIMLICQSSGRIVTWQTPDDLPENSLHCDCLDGQGYFIYYQEK